jgi:hypothetical protein
MLDVVKVNEGNLESAPREEAYAFVIYGTQKMTAPSNLRNWSDSGEFHTTGTGT